MPSQLMALWTVYSLLLGACLALQGRATRSDSGRSATYMTINRIISAGWSASNDGIGASMIVMTHLENLTALRAPSEPVLEATQYDVCSS